MLLIFNYCVNCYNKLYRVSNARRPHQYCLKVKSMREHLWSLLTLTAFIVVCIGMCTLVQTYNYKYQYKRPQILKKNFSFILRVHSALNSVISTKRTTVAKIPLSEIFRTGFMKNDDKSTLIISSWCNFPHAINIKKSV